MQQTDTAAGVTTVTKLHKPKNVYRKYAPLLIMMSPGLLYLLFNNYLPMFGIAIAFKDINFAKGNGAAIRGLFSFRGQALRQSVG